MMHGVTEPSLVFDPLCCNVLQCLVHADQHSLEMSMLHLQCADCLGCGWHEEPGAQVDPLAAEQSRSRLQDVRALTLEKPEDRRWKDAAADKTNS